MVHIKKKIKNPQCITVSKLFFLNKFENIVLLKRTTLNTRFQTQHYVFTINDFKKVCSYGFTSLIACTNLL